MPIRFCRSKPASSLEEISSLLPEVSPLKPSEPALADGEPLPAEQSPAPPFLSLREAAEWLCVSVSTIKRLIAKSELPTVRIGKRQKIPASTLAAYVSRDVLLPEQVQKSLDQI